MKVYVGITDIDWSTYLASHPHIHEANFWRPYGARPFRVLQPGEPFIFKAKSPVNKIVGGAIFEGFVSLNISTAWEFFEDGNGVESQEELIRRIASITGETRDEIGDREIGCILLRDIQFFQDPLPVPKSFSANIVQGKSYPNPSGDSVIDMATLQLLNKDLSDFSEVNAREALGPTRGLPRLVTPRLGQRGFKAIVQEVYVRRCAITNHKILPTLEAAHILPVANGGQHRVDNGLLLRSDVHTMFDRGYLGVDEEYRLRVSRRLKSEFGNGDEFYSRQGEQIRVPSRSSDLPSQEFLTWHLKNVFH